MIKEVFENVREKAPLIHNITNYVTVNDVANVLLACGGSPIMADDLGEVAEVTALCGGLNINIGTLNQSTIPAMILAGQKSNQLDHPVLLDPVGAGASKLRTETAIKIMNEVKLTAIRGNISEIKTLANGSGSTKGVDADVADALTEENLKIAINFIKSFSEKTGCIIAVTGAIDIVADKDKAYIIRNGRAEMGKVTGTGCQLSSLVTAFIVANPDNKLEAAAAAVMMMGVAGEIGYENLLETDGNLTYRNKIIDAIYNMDGETLEERAKYEII